MILLRAISLIGVLVLAVSCNTERLNLKTKDNTKVRISPRLSEEEIRSAILHYTPIGSSSDEVLTFVRNRLKYKHDRDLTYEHRPASKRGSGFYPTEIGKNNIFINLGTFGFNPLLRTDVYVSWAFDKNDRLIDVIVEEQTDSL